MSCPACDYLGRLCQEHVVTLVDVGASASDNCPGCVLLGAACVDHQVREYHRQRERLFAEVRP